MIKRLFKILIFITILFPFTVFAKDDGISNYFIETKVMPNGDLLVKELFVLEGEFNGGQRFIKYRQPSHRNFTGSKESFESNDIYNGTDVELIQIKAIEVDKNVNFNYLYKDGDNFVEAGYSSNGIYGQYTVTRDFNGINLKIYNPSGRGKRGFYIEYIVKNLAVLHNDIAEVYWNLLTSENLENIKNLEMIVNIPNNQNELRVWGHGPLNGETDIVNKNQLLYKVKDLYNSTPIDIRFVFDKDVVNTSTKTTNVDALDIILEVEGKWAEEANVKREEAIKEEDRKRTISYIIDVVKVLWIGGLIYIIYKVYNKHDKEYQTTFKTKYFRDFPANYGPSNVGYLISKKIGTKEFSSTILDLIARKHITYKNLKKNEYQLIKNSNEINDPLAESEKRLIKMLFEGIGIDDKVTVHEINKYANKHYQSFLNDYNDWKDAATNEAEDKKFYEEKGTVIIKTITYSVVGFIATILSLGYVIYPFISLLVIVSALVSFVYFITINKRTKEGQEQFAKWMGLKNFIKDFGKFEVRDLPQIHLWEKYLVYAVVFGSAKKLAKAMEIKFAEMPNTNYTIGDYMFDVAHIRMINNLNSTINQGVSTAVSSALSTKAISESKTSSGGGFGGGFSGGSFGGGGGGGGGGIGRF